MNKKPYSQYFLLFLLIASIIVVYFIAKPFLGPLILAAVFAFLFQPIYKRFLTTFGGREGFAASSTTLIAIILVLLPIILLGTQIFKESTQLYQFIISGGAGSFLNTIESMLGGFEIDFSKYAEQGLEILIQNLDAIFSSLAKMILNAFVFLTAFYFFLKDGNKLTDFVVALSPLENKDDEFIISRLKLAVSAAVKGNLTIGLIQGALTGIGFAIFGVPNAVLWGGVAAISAFLPGIGTALVIAPAVLFLFFIGNNFQGIGLLIWGFTAVGLIDNVLGPRLVGRGMQLHPLAVFIAVLGGLAFFGPLGFILGPVAISVCLALIDIHSTTRK